MSRGFKVAFELSDDDLEYFRKLQRETPELRTKHGVFGMISVEKAFEHRQCLAKPLFCQGEVAHLAMRVRQTAQEEEPAAVTTWQQSLVDTQCLLEKTECLLMLPLELQHLRQVVQAVDETGVFGAEQVASHG